MPRHVYDLPDLVIASGNSNSNAIAADPHYWEARGFSIQGPAALTGTVTVAVSNDGGSTFSTLQDGGSDVAVAADQVVFVDFQGWDSMRLESAGTEAADRTFFVKAVEEL